MQDLNLRPLAPEASALSTELITHNVCCVGFGEREDQILEWLFQLTSQVANQTQWRVYIKPKLFASIKLVELYDLILFVDGMLVGQMGVDFIYRRCHLLRIFGRKDIHNRLCSG